MALRTFAMVDVLRRRLRLDVEDMDTRFAHVFHRQASQSGQERARS